MKERGLQSALLVSDGFHLPWAKLLFREQGVEVYGSPAAKSPTSTIVSLRFFFTVRESVAIVAHYFGGAFKLVSA